MLCTYVCVCVVQRAVILVLLWTYYNLVATTNIISLDLARHLNPITSMFVVAQL